MRLVAVFGLLYLAWSWFRIARDFADGVARYDWHGATALFLGERDRAVYERSSDPRGFWWCTASRVAIHSVLTLVLLIMVLEA
jgi:hypothetical protein